MQQTVELYRGDEQNGALHELPIIEKISQTVPACYFIKSSVALVLEFLFMN